MCFSFVKFNDSAEHISNQIRDAMQLNEYLSYNLNVVVDTICFGNIAYAFFYKYNYRVYVYIRFF